MLLIAGLFASTGAGIGAAPAQAALPVPSRVVPLENPAALAGAGSTVLANDTARGDPAVVHNPAGNLHAPPPQGVPGAHPTLTLSAAQGAPGTR
jgi:hypothetical protein